MIETPRDKMAPDRAGVDAPLDGKGSGLAGLAGSAGSDLRFENIAICILRFLQLWLRVKLILFRAPQRIQNLWKFA